MDFDIGAVRARFPALTVHEAGGPVAFLDGPAGTQVPIDVIEATDAVYREGVSNLGGPFASSRRAQTITDAARGAMADLFNAEADEIVFGQNMTSLTFPMSRAIGRTWSDGDRVLITSLDHAANRDPWIIAADEMGVSVDEVPFDPDTGRLSPDAVIAAIGPRTRLVAVTAASNALGSVTDLGPIVQAAHDVGALVYVDAVHYCAHRLVDVAALDPDFLVASAYKFFGPHTGILYGRRDHLAALTPYKLTPAPAAGPGRWETGTQSFANLAGVTAAVDYLAGLSGGEDTRRDGLVASFGAIERHEGALSRRFVAGLTELPRVRLHGAADGNRVSTFALTVEGVTPSAACRALADVGIQTWSGDYYATAVMDELGLAGEGGALRIGFVHYTSVGEVDAVLEALEDLSRSS
jgi:cysteine desulfurase family protein (TIGR01976 family)